MILVSPVVTMGADAHAGSRKNLLGENPPQELVEKYSLEKQVTSAAPPAFIVHAFDDKSVSARNSLMLFASLLEKNVSASLHVFRTAGTRSRCATIPARPRNGRICASCG